MIELYINGKQADLFDNTSISLNKTYESLENPTNYYCDYSKTVDLPVSKNNNEIFSHFNRLDSLVTNLTIDPAKKLPFVLLYNMEPVMQGYVQLMNTNTVYNDNKYQITLYSSLGYVINELKQLTFNPYASDIDPQYVIDSPWSEVYMNRNITKASFEQVEHAIDGTGILDYIGQIPTYQGKYNDFSSDKMQVLVSGRTDDMSQERDEHYMREFRSYMQQPFVWVDKLWKMAKDKLESITDYTMKLDRSWFTVDNPYYKDLIYTCPSLTNSDDNYKEYNEIFKAFPPHENASTNMNTITWYEKQQSNLNVIPSTYYTVNHEPSQVDPRGYLYLHSLQHDSGDVMYSNGVFNPNANYGATVFKSRLKLTLFAPNDPELANGYAKINGDNPFYVKIFAVNTRTNQPIQGASKTYLLFSGSHNSGTNTYDEEIDLGITRRSDPSVTMSVANRPHLMGDYTGIAHDNADGYFWETNVTFSLNVVENVPYKVCVNIYNANIHKPFEYAIASWIPQWDWLWTDLFFSDTTSPNLRGDIGYSFYVDCMMAEVVTQENTRSFSPIDLYRIFPKETSLCDVLLNYSKMFGLVWTVDEDKKELTIMTRNRFFNDMEILDWTDKIDRSKDFTFQPLNFNQRYVLFNFDEGESTRLKGYENKYEVTYGTKKIDTGYEFNADENKLFDKLIPSIISQRKQFSANQNTEYEDMPGFVGYSAMVYPDEHFVDNDSEGSNAGISGAFYFRNGIFDVDPEISRLATNGRRCIVITDDTAHQIQTQTYCWNFTGENMTLCYTMPDVSTISNLYNNKYYSVHFAAPAEYYFKNTKASNKTKYIYDNRWKNYIDERYSSQNKVLTAYVYLTPYEYSKLNFKQFIKIDNLLYTINKISDFNVNSLEPTKVELVQVWDIDAYTDGQTEFPYVFTEQEDLYVGTTYENFTVYSSGTWLVLSNPDWITVNIPTVGGNILQVKANSLPNNNRDGEIVLSLQNNPNVRTVVRVHQTVNCHLSVLSDRTIVFAEDGGTVPVEVSSNIVDWNVNPININVVSLSARGSAGWLSAAFQQSLTAARNDGFYQLNVTAQPNETTMSRCGYIDLSLTCNGNTYTARINVGQQAGHTHTHNTDINLQDGFVYNSNNQLVTAGDPFTAGETYHFQDYFNENILSTYISNGTVTINGKSGLQTVYFTPQLSPMDTDTNVGGGMIVVTFTSGNTRTYNYSVEAAQTPVQTYNFMVSSTNGNFSVNNARQTTNFSQTVSEGDTITLEAFADTGYAFSYWENVSKQTGINTNPLTITISSSLADADYNIVYRPVFNYVSNLAKVIFDANVGGYLTIGADPTHITTTEVRYGAVGTTINGLRAHANQGSIFLGWSDGSLTNPRDYVIVGDATVAAMWDNAQTPNFTITTDGSELLKQGQVFMVDFNNGTAIKGEYNTQDSLQIDGDTYDITLSMLELSDDGSNPYIFNSYIVNKYNTEQGTSTITNYYTDTVNMTSYTVDDNMLFKATVLAPHLYHAKGDWVNGVDEVVTQQDAMLASINLFVDEDNGGTPLSNASTMWINNIATDAPLTIVIPKPFILSKVYAGLSDILPAFDNGGTPTPSRNGMWNIYVCNDLGVLRTRLNIFIDRT